MYWEAVEEWYVHYALFARSGFAPAAAEEMQKAHGIQVDLKHIEKMHNPI